MKTYKTRDNTYISEIYVGAVLCICEANQRKEARRGALAMAKKRAAK